METPSEGHCLHFARAAAAHSGDGNRLHDDVARASEIFQSSTMAALLDAVYDGGLTYAELEEHGDFGLGTFNQLDGEMVAIDGQFFHLHADGSAEPVDPEDKTPFAAVTFFRGDAVAVIEESLQRHDLESMLDEMVPSTNLFYAVRIDGVFSKVTTRTVRKQELPYRPLVEAAASQAVSEFTDIAGSIAGFRAPNYAQGLTVAGYHLHFIDAARGRGGHVLDFVLDRGTLHVDQDAGIHVELPETSEFMNADLSGRDVAREISEAESG